MKPNYHYTYMLTALNPTDARVWYFGVRSCYCLPSEDTRYMSSSRPVREAMAQGVEFRKTILRVFGNRDRAAAHEIDLHVRYDVADNPLFFNAAICSSIYLSRLESYWTLERCKADALRFTTRTQWARQSSGAYNSAKKHKWLDACCAHMELQCMPRGYWTLERCKEDALRFTSRKEWSTQSKGAYYVARANKWLPVCCAHMVRRRRENDYWTLERCKEDALRFHSRRAWEEGSSAGYNAALRRKWVSRCCRHMVRTMRPHGYWTLERCKASARKYQTRKAWNKGASGAYQAAICNGWLPVCCAHMQAIVGANRIWTLARCKADAKRFTDFTTWRKQSNKAYAAARVNKWLPECTKHMQRRTKPPGYWTLERCKASAREYKTTTAWMRGCSSAYTAAHKKGWLPQCCRHMMRTPSTPNYSSGYWTLARCKASARKYKTRTAWAKAEGYPYKLALENQWMDECCAHMGPSRQSRSAIA